MTEDYFLYLEDAHSDQAVAWAKEQTTKALAVLENTPMFPTLKADAMTILGDKDKTIFGAIRKDNFAYAFITTEEKPLGRLCRMTAAKYLKNSSDWDTLLDVGELAKAEDTKWSYAGSRLSPNKTNLMISLSPDGGDAKVVREFNIAEKSFTNAGLDIPLGKVNYAYVDDDTLLVASNCDGDVTESGYARNARLFKRGQPFTSTEIRFTAKKGDMAIYPQRFWDDGYQHMFLEVALTFWTAKLHYVQQNGSLIALNLPEKLDVQDVDKNFIYLLLQEDWEVDGDVFLMGDIVAVHLQSALRGSLQVYTAYRAPNNCVTESFSVLNGRTFVVSQLKDVCGELVILKKKAGNVWTYDHTVPLPKVGSVGFGSYRKKQNQMVVSYTDEVTPNTDFVYCLKQHSLTEIKRQKSYFNDDDVETTQTFATSADGTKIPYFITHKKGLIPNGKNPTILYGYGGFLINLTPSYSAIIGKLWLEKGGVFVRANIRGGAEYGPDWHNSVLKLNRHKCFEDFEAVAHKLIADDITSSKYLGIMGGSNGGLLVGACTVRNPDLFAAVCCAVPLLDMIRLEHIGAGASWVGEYGKPSDSPEMSDYLYGYSPYHKVKPDVTYPRIYFTASQADDLTHPCHARKMVALMQSQGHNVLYNETAEGGHTGGTDISKRAGETALKYAYFWNELT